MDYEIHLRERRSDRHTALLVHHAVTLRAAAGPLAASRYLRQAKVAAAVVKRVANRGQRMRRASVRMLLESFE